PVLRRRDAARAGVVQRQRERVAPGRAPRAVGRGRHAARRVGLSHPSRAAAYRSRVPFTILPALDVSAGRLVVVEGGRPRRVAAFGGGPVAAARAMVQAGAGALHVVDVDLALEGTRGLDVAAIRTAAPLALLQVSGGIVDLSTARRYLAA